MKDGPSSGLHLNVNKTEVFWPNEDPGSGLAGIFSSNIARPLHGVKLLGGPASVDFDFNSELVMKRVTKTILLMDTFVRINDPQCELLLLRACAGISKLYFAMSTCSLRVFEMAQHSFDAALRSALERIVTASGPGFGDWQWRLSTLSFAFGRLGVYSSASGTTFDDALCMFNTKIETDILSNLSEIAAPKLIKKLTYMYFTRVTQIAQSTFTLSSRHMALWQSLMEDHTCDWLRVVPISGLGQTMNACSKVFTGDIYGDHAVSCAGIIGIKHQHNVVRDTLVDICFRSGISAGKEVDIRLGGGWSSPLTQTGMADFVPVVREGCSDPTEADPKVLRYSRYCSTEHSSTEKVLIVLTMTGLKFCDALTILDDKYGSNLDVQQYKLLGANESGFYHVTLNSQLDRNIFDFIPVEIRYDPNYLLEQFAGLVIQRALPFNHFDHEQTTRVFQNTMQPRYTHSAPHGVPGSYMCVTAHWIEPGTWQMMKRVISFEEFSSPHTGHALFKMLIKVLTNFNLEDKVMSITLDNDSNNTSAMDKLKLKYDLSMEGRFYHSRCIAHIINLVVQAGLGVPAIDATRESFKTMLKNIFKSSARTRQRYVKIYKDAEKPCLRPNWDVPTRWNSIYHMFLSGLKQQNTLAYFHDLLANKNRCNHLPAENWVIIQSLTQLLEVFNIAMKILSGVYYPTSPLVLQQVFFMSTVLSECELEGGILSSMIKPMKKKLRKYFQHMTSIITCAAALNSCFNVNGVNFLIESISLDLEFFDVGFTSKSKSYFKESLEGLYNLIMQNMDHLDAKERKQDKCPLEIPLDFEEDFFDDEVQRNEFIPLSDEEIALDASSEDTLSPGGQREHSSMGKALIVLTMPGPKFCGALATDTKMFLAV
uniref:Zinc finger BED domain-containing protein RICESLEEPER 2-like n=1 Tax=Tanacetum cinerariifolium TaxID=118510 RepID=A0A6L2NEN1_TANCI|nr:hypothetical protein [Tanacetum cinerariifolium]